MSAKIGNFTYFFFIYFAMYFYKTLANLVLVLQWIFLSVNRFLYQIYTLIFESDYLVEIQSQYIRCPQQLSLFWPGW